MCGKQLNTVAEGCLTCMEPPHSHVRLLVHLFSTTFSSSAPNERAWTVTVVLEVFHTSLLSRPKLFRIALPHSRPACCCLNTAGAI
jgi:hypothetical protein